MNVGINNDLFGRITATTSGNICISSDFIIFRQLSIQEIISFIILIFITPLTAPFLGIFL